MTTRVTDVHRADGRFLYPAFLRWEVAYVLVLLLASVTGDQSSLKQLANGFALMFVLRIAVFLLTRVHHLDASSRAILSCSALFTVANLLTNIDQEQFSESIKIFSIFLFYFAGETMDGDLFERPPGFLLVALFVGLPVLSALASVYLGHNDRLDDGSPLSFHANRNNAVAFAVVSTWTLILWNARRWAIAGYLIFCVIVFKTLGALLALMVAVYLAYIRFNLLGTAVAVTCAAGLYYWLGDDLGILSRAETSWTALDKVLQASGSIWGLAKLSYEQIYEAAGTTDISLIFRLKHWINLINIYADGTFAHQIFGFGVLSSVQLTDENLLPHNDYLRFLFELGPGMLFCFVAINWIILKATFGRFISIPAIFLFIYFFSDNLINNMLLMSFFYFTAGAIVSNRRRFGIIL